MRVARLDLLGDGVDVGSHLLQRERAFVWHVPVMSEDGYPIITLPPQSVPPLGIWNMKGHRREPLPEGDGAIRVKFDVINVAP
jgi:hypothetical protein